MFPVGPLSPPPPPHAVAAIAERTDKKRLRVYLVMLFLIELTAMKPWGKLLGQSIDQLPFHFDQFQYY